MSARVPQTSARDLPARVGIISPPPTPPLYIRRRHGRRRAPRALSRLARARWALRGEDRAVVTLPTRHRSRFGLRRPPGLPRLDRGGGERGGIRAETRVRGGRRGPRHERVARPEAGHRTRISGEEEARGKKNLQEKNTGGDVVRRRRRTARRRVHPRRAQQARRRRRGVRGDARVRRRQPGKKKVRAHTRAGLETVRRGGNRTRDARALGRVSKRGPRQRARNRRARNRGLERQSRGGAGRRPAR